MHALDGFARTSHILIVLSTEQLAKTYEQKTAVNCGTAETVETMESFLQTNRKIHCQPLYIEP